MKAIVNKSYLNRTEDLSVEELKSVCCFQHLSDDELQEVLVTIKKFTQLTYEIFSRTIPEALVIKMNDYKTKAA